MKYGSILSGCLLLLLFALSMWTTHKDWNPYQALMDARNIWRSVNATGMILPTGSFRKRPDWTADTRCDLTAPDKASPGYLTATRTHTQDHSYVVELLGETGELLHSWPVDHSRMIKDSENSSFVHTTAELPDGPLLTPFNEAIGMDRINACGNPVWPRDYQLYHHSLHPDEAGRGYWTWQSKIWTGGHDQFMLRFDVEAGETLESINLFSDAKPDQPEQWLLLLVPGDSQFNRDTKEYAVKDILHPDDVEPLPAALAPAIPMFRTGDLLISFRNINLVALIYWQTHKIVWTRYGPWHNQHDADWHSNGTITFFSKKNGWGRINIIEIDPEQTHDLLHGSGLKFASFIKEQHQRLPNGNWLIVSSMEGRVIEIIARARQCGNSTTTLMRTTTGSSRMPRD